MRSTRTMMNWVLLVAMLISLPGRTSGRFVCMLGMARAGIACPRCHGHVASELPPGSAVGNTCCKFVAGQPAPVSDLALTQVDEPILGYALVPSVNAGLLGAPARELAAHSGPRASPRTRTSGYLSDILRL